MSDALSDDVFALRAALAAAEARALAAEADMARVEARLISAQADAARVKAAASDAEAQIAWLKLEIEKLRRELYGTRSERKARLLDQLEFQLEDLEATAGEDDLAAEQAAAKGNRPSVDPARQDRPQTVPGGLAA